MPMVEHSIKNLNNGVSQQPASMRLPSQAELQENAISTLLDGMGKRGNTNHIAKLMAADSMNPVEDLFVHFINRDADERYAVVIGNSAIKVFDLMTGTEKTVNAPNGYGYLAATTPREAFSCVTVADHTFILNKTKVVAKTATVSPTPKPQGLVWVRSGLYSTKYTINLVADGTTYTATQTTPNSDGDASQWRTEVIAQNLANQIYGFGGDNRIFDVIAVGSQIFISRTNEAEFSVTTQDSYGDQAMSCCKGRVQKYQDLPSKAGTTFDIIVENDPESRRDNFYLKYENGIWTETCGYNLTNNFDKSTMPHRLVRESDGTFTFEQCDWLPRTVGDEETCATPSFVDNTISDIFYFRNRLGFLSDENIVYSVAGDYYNFWPETAMQTLDTDPIDTTAGSSKVSILRHAVPLMERLLLFADQVQFSQSSNAVLSPDDIQIDQTTTYEYSPLAKPVAAGSSIFFTTKRGTYTGVMEYLIDPDTKVNQAIDMTSHVPEYIPTNVFHLAAGVNINVLLALTLNERNAVYVYNYWWEADEKIQSAWHKWTFDEGAVILSAEIIDSVVYFVIKRSDGLYLESMEILAPAADEGLKYRVLLDRRATATGVFDADTGITTWTIPYPVPVTKEVIIVRGPDFEGNGIGVSTYRGAAGTETKVYARGDYSAGECYVGLSYNWRYRPSEQFLKEDAAETVSIISGRLQLHHMTVRYANTIFFKALVTPVGRPTFTYANDVRLGEVTIGTPVPADGTFTFPVMAKSNLVTIEFQNDSHYPCYFQSIDWKARYTPKAQRM